ncbi:hypothetical protein A1O1_06373 [Capronia coronata CBS 617.96]|uniref:Xylanolytic transcriptional activator regulatory domain-containing protein n=1 Tax=Capronia coronata CBS 617.96 TaxID=1182541 RepID=W9YUP5_9EURO|nr:uncharacterized protein A1O1_06373 [Capronia coronata CBS 617.96]EXJ86004.1 hypothetical protein A1O1_06373 [Capronia coronata CBS 617.96]
MERIEQLITDNLKRRNGSLCSSTPSHRLKLTFLGENEGPSHTTLPKPITKPNDDGRPGPVEAESPSFENVGRIYCAGYKLGDINMFHGVPFLSREGQKWIGFRADENDVPIGKHEAKGPLWQNRRPAWPRASRPRTVADGRIQDLPPRAVVEKYLDLYHRSEASHAFPLADPVLFPQTLDKAYDANLTGSLDALSAKACIVSFFALAASLLGDAATESQLPPVDILDGGSSAELLFLDILNARASTEAVDALMMQAVYQFTCGHFQPLDITLSTASRFLFMLGAHLYPGEELDLLPSEPQSIETRTILHRRDLFWVCYSLDREITFRTGRPPIINDTSCDLTFPKWYLKQRAADFDGNLRFPGDLGLSLIKSKAYEKLYSPHSLQKSDAEILRDIRELDELLENWRQSHPAESRPKLSFSLETQDSLCFENMSVRYFLLQLEYYHCMTTIHQASSRCKNWAHNHRVHEGLSSSLDLALESSRSLLSFLHAADPVLVKIPNIFWVVLFYPVSATLVLFCNILLNPSSASAASDALLLRNCRDHITTQFYPHSGLSETQSLHLQSVYDFSAEVIRSAESLITQSPAAG